MKKTTNAILLSALVFPGAGHVYLKRYVSALLLGGISFVAVYYLTVKIVEHAMQVVEKVQSGGVPADISVISDLVTRQLAGTAGQQLDLATYTIIICWLIGVLDTYRISRAQEKPTNQI